MTGYLTGTYCRTCGYIYTEPVTGGTCPICKYYGREGYLARYDDPRWLRVVTLVTYIEDEELRRTRRPKRTTAETPEPSDTVGEIERQREEPRPKRRLPTWLVFLKALLVGGKIE